MKRFAFPIPKTEIVGLIMKPGNFGGTEAASVTPPQHGLPVEAQEGSYPLLVRVEEAAVITGLPASLIRKSFIDERKRPANIPAPPPHKRIGRSVYIIRDRLADWIRTLDQGRSEMEDGHPGRGRPTVVQRRANQPANDNTENSPLPAIERAAGKARR